jgi:ABC-2 type transport system ATP-binding protein
MEYPIVTKNVSKTYNDGTKALIGLEMKIGKGEFYGLMGRNGAGKTTLINILTGQIKPDSGDIEVMGIDPTKEPAKVRSKVGILPEKETPMSFLTPREHFEFIGNVHKIPDEKLEDQIEFWADKLELEDKLDQKNQSLSRGQQQKVMFASAFIHEPELVFIDEPLANLDPPIQRKLKNYLTQYNKKGNTIVLSTHYVEAAIELCNKILVIENGTALDEKNTKDIGSAKQIEQMLE